MIFLGITIDSVAMECRLPGDKLLALRREVTHLAGKQKVRLRELHSLLGKLNFACRIILMGRIFCRQLSLATAGVSGPRHFICLSKDLRADLKVWDVFLATYNGQSWISGRVSAPELTLFTDVAGPVGYGAFFQGRWSAGRWPEA